MRYEIADCRLQIADYRLQIADCRLQIADCRLQIADCKKGRKILRYNFIWLKKLTKKLNIKALR